MKLAAAAALLFLPVPALAASPPSVGSLGRDLVLSQSVPGRVVAVASNVSIESAVAGDVIVWGGDVSFGPNGSIAGNLVVFGGTIRDRIGPSGRPLPVAGTVSTPGTLLPLYLAEMRRAPWETSVLSPVVWGFKLLALAAWLAIAVALLYVFGSPLARAADRAESDWAGALTAGALGVLTIFLAAAATLTLLPSSIAELLAAYPYDFLYGSIAADTSIAKKYAAAGRHCHSWNVGFEIHDTRELSNLPGKPLNIWRLTRPAG